MESVFQLALPGHVPDRDHPGLLVAGRLLHLALRLPRTRRLLQGLLGAACVPAMTLIIPIFLMLHWLGLLDRSPG
jgi:hypothetical protein